MMARRFLVSGRVQGVGFRWFVVTGASRLGLSGWTRNLPDGRVEVVAQGSAEDLDRLQQELTAGPRHARVEAVESIEASVDPAMREFLVRY